jgi:glycosyltransferase involved in cell wall biosynthesis
LYSARRIDARFSNGLAQAVALRVETCVIDMRHNLHPVDLSAIQSVRRYLRRDGPFDVLHCHSTKAGLVGRIAGLGMGCRTLYTPHGLVTNAPFRSRGYLALAGWLERRLAGIGDAVICVSKEERQHALEVRLPEAKIRVAPNGIDLSEAERYLEGRAPMRARLSVGNADICVGFVGRMIAGKAPGMLLEAFAEARKGLPVATKLVFVGSGPEAPVLQSRIEQLGMQQDVLLAGEMIGAQAMAAFDVFVLPSLSEAFPYVLLEALSMGLPVISTDIGGVSELVHEGRNGFVTRRSAPEEMSEALRSLLVDADLRRRMGEASKELGRQFTLEGMAQRIVGIYRELLS